MPPTMFLKEEDLRRRNWNKIEMVYTNACKDALHMHGNTKQEFFTQKSNFKDPAAASHFFKFSVQKVLWFCLRKQRKEVCRVVGLCTQSSVTREPTIQQNHPKIGR